MSNERFIISDLTVEDKETGLIWTRDTNMAGRPMNWSDANNFIMQLNRQRYAGYSDWGLPTIDEFKTLVKIDMLLCLDTYRFLNNIGFKNVQSVYCWSSSACAGYRSGYGSGAWGVDVLGFMSAFNESNSLYVWPVRAGQ